MNKNDVVELTASDIGSDMEGICHHEGTTVFVPGMLIGEKGTVRIERVTSSVAFGKLLKIQSAVSPERREPCCISFPKCGGCSCRHMDYQSTLCHKRQQVQTVFHKIAHMDLDVPPIIGMDDPSNYRNKTALPLGGTAAHPEIGFYAPRTHRLIPAENCPNAMHPTAEICHELLLWMKKYAVAPYDEVKGTGLIRHAVIRVNRQHEAMVTLVVNGKKLPHVDELWAKIQPLGVVSLFENCNIQRTNVIFGREFHLLKGCSTLKDTLCGFSFNISPASFFQVNPVQTEKLYQTALDFAEISPEDTAIDLYCGAGTISLLLSRKARQVIGVEVVPEAVENARENARENGVKNVRFMLGTAEERLPELCRSGTAMDVVVVDPPRKGLEKSVIDTLCQVCPKRIVYVSCNPATQARDVALFREQGYILRKIQPVDMFCYTSGVENVVQLSREQ